MDFTSKAETAYNSLPDHVKVTHTVREKKTVIREIADALKESGAIGFTAGAIGSYLVGRVNENTHDQAMADASVGAGIGWVLEKAYDKIKQYL